MLVVGFGSLRDSWLGRSSACGTTAHVYFGSSFVWALDTSAAGDEAQGVSSRSRLRCFLCLYTSLLHGCGVFLFRAELSRHQNVVIVEVFYKPEFMKIVPLLGDCVLTKMGLQSHNERDVPNLYMVTFSTQSSKTHTPSDSTKSMSRSEICPWSPQSSLDIQAHPYLRNSVQTVSVRTPFVSMLPMLARPWRQFRRTVSHLCSLLLGAPPTDGASHPRSAGKDGLDGIIVIHPVIVLSALSFRTGPVLEATGHVGQVSGMRPQVQTIRSTLVGTVAFAQGAAADGDVGALVALEVCAGHGHAEAVTDTDVEIGCAVADVPFEFGVTAPARYTFGITNEHGAGVGETN